ncbi:PREDICTED: aminoacyl tRNA synthase complex-interacting multifunctional protein 2 [Ceratosolen solmsi marchali]|uniref:Aminoacyl tRNA synthase complex-interacting multifunctional protein 2 n=1 Tax=Ceratosolen solmsi marchali TaxID=326594 RepID=A0AAJ6YEY9_9HYME|nr:PREDICTED: aminoacyl tRNA synthase complex-interacting multifunctional protein 2 [Ceratosolen solmsi marchali]
MYALEPIVVLPDRIDLPTVMYELPNVHDEGGTTIASIGDDFSRQKDIPEYHCLEAKQMRILKQLKELKQYVEYVCIAVRLSKTITLPSINLPFSNDNNPIQADVIVNASPTSPPYSILALQRIWTDTIFNVDVHLHSTVLDTIKPTFEENLLTNANGEIVHNINLKLIWKDVPDVQFVTKVYSHPLEGEANLLRYLARLINYYDYQYTNSLTDAVSIDTILDLCLQLSYKTTASIDPIVTKFAHYLNKSQWLLNQPNPSLADVAAWSALKRQALNKIPREIKRWYDLCEKTFLAS